MDKFEIREQVRLSVTKVASLVASGIRYRLFRTAITVLIVALAVAFLMAILSDGLLTRQALRHIATESASRRQLQFWLHRLSTPLDIAAIGTMLNSAKEHGPRWQELKAWGATDDETLRSNVALAKLEQRYLAFFAKLTEGQLRALVGARRGHDIFDQLQSEEARANFTEQLGAFGRVLPGKRDEFFTFLDQWPAIKSLRERVIAANTTSIGAIREQLRERSPLQLLAALEETDVALLQREGFVIEGSQLAAIRATAGNEQWVSNIERLLMLASFRQRLTDFARLSSSAPLDARILFKSAATARGTTWLLEAAKETGAALELDAEGLRKIASEQMRQIKLERSEEILKAAGGSSEGLTGLSSQMLWLISVSLLVCVVGIANAMLMSVAERFREIATMKCLGATDGFIMLNFLMESGAQGFVGGVLGALAGLIFGFLHGVSAAGAIILQAPPWGSLLLGGAVTVALGIVLSILAATYPALAAARLAPMEAMRVE